MAAASNALRANQKHIGKRCAVATIQSLGSAARRMNGYLMDDVGKVVLGMDSVIGIDLKEQIFGKSSSLVWLDDGWIVWPESLVRVFAGFALVQDFVVGGNVVDFFVEEFGLVLEFENWQSKVRKQLLLSQGYRVVLFW